MAALEYYKQSNDLAGSYIGAPCSFLPQCGHGDDGVPKGGRDGGEGGVLNVLFTVKHDGGEDDDGHGQGEHQEAQL